MLTAQRERRGTTLVELVVAMLVGGMVLGLIASISVRQQRIYGDAADAGALAAQLRDASAVLPIELRAAASAAGDLRGGEARDTSLELRATIATGVVCDTLATSLVLAPAAPGGGGAVFGSALSTIQTGDTAWVFTPSDSADDWIPHRVAGITTAAAGQCSPLALQLDAGGTTSSRSAIALDGIPVLSTALGRPIRVTRPLRYSLYRSSDGNWYLGERDWNPATIKFNTIQPVSGPYLPASSRGLAFQYIDSLGVQLATPVMDTHGVALVRMELRGGTKAPVRALGAAGPSGIRVDSVSVTVLLHNRR